MGAWETVKSVIAGEADISAEISTEVHMAANIVYMRNKRTWHKAGFTYEDGTPDWQIEERTKMILKRLKEQYHKDMIRNVKTLKRIEEILGIVLEDWQKEYILSDGTEYISGRMVGKTLAHQIKQLLESPEPMEIYSNEMIRYVDEYHGIHYERMYVDGLKGLRETLAENGLVLREVRLHFARNFTDGKPSYKG